MGVYSIRGAVAADAATQGAGHCGTLSCRDAALAVVGGLRVGPAGLRSGYLLLGTTVVQRYRWGAWRGYRLVHPEMV